MSDEHRRRSWNEWLRSLGDADRETADRLLAVMSAAGAREPERWVRSEVNEGIAQAARFSFLRAVWRDLDRWRDDEFVDRFLNDPALMECARPALRKCVAKVAFHATLDLIMTIDHEEDVGAEPGMPAWRLMEVGEGWELTGRGIGGLHESLLEVDPRGVEADDIRGW